MKLSPEISKVNTKSVEDIYFNNLFDNCMYEIIKDYYSKPANKKKLEKVIQKWEYQLTLNAQKEEEFVKTELKLDKLSLIPKNTYSEKNIEQIRWIHEESLKKAKEDFLSFFCEN